ncbi:MAG: TetR/AcrR family transcriptional regulator; helix-turn-helix transcriptional regulator, partial [Alistipes sp.]|nr:TetR/AcrR family transcriptional regulator; helix-turn-helix transcriptional regulator [Alistipes sp.]
EYIVEQTVRMFIAEGAKSVRMDDIASRLSVSKRTLYELFGDKENLLFEAMRFLSEEIDARHRQLCAHAHDILEEIFLVLEDTMLVSGEMYHVMASLRKFYPAIWNRLEEANREHHRCKLRERLEQGIADGLFRDDFDVDLAISMLYYMATALMTRSEMMIPEGMSSSQAFIQLLVCFFRGIATPRGGELIATYAARYR